MQATQLLQAGARRVEAAAADTVEVAGRVVVRSWAEFWSGPELLRAGFKIALALLLGWLALPLAQRGIR